MRVATASWHARAALRVDPTAPEGVTGHTAAEPFQLGVGRGEPTGRQELRADGRRRPRQRSHEDRAQQRRPARPHGAPKRVSTWTPHSLRKAVGSSPPAKMKTCSLSRA